MIDALPVATRRYFHSARFKWSVQLADVKIYDFKETDRYLESYIAGKLHDKTTVLAMIRLQKKSLEQAMNSEYLLFVLVSKAIKKAVVELNVLADEDPFDRDVRIIRENHDRTTVS